MKIIETALDDCVIIEPQIYYDSRGCFFESYHLHRYTEIAGIGFNFVQDNTSFSVKNVLRGLHFQKMKPQGKLVRVLNGEVYDVAVDLRVNSNTFGQWEGVVLSDMNKRQLWIPPGFAHGFVVLSETTQFEYKCTDFYDPLDQHGIIWNDIDLAIDWPVIDPLLSEKDKANPTFSSLKI